jgi:acyl-CoA thioesterase I
MSLAFPSRIFVPSRRQDRPAGLVRRSLLGALLMLAPGAALAQSRPKVVTLLGDSITAGYGLPASVALPVRLEAELKKSGQPVRVRGAGVSGDTTAKGLARIDFSVQKDTDVCVVALGGNDLLQGQDLKRMRANLDAIIRRLKARRITVVLAGIKAPRVIGANYAREFEGVYAGLAKTHNVVFVPDMLGPVALNSALNQRDGIHPNAEGVKVVSARLAPAVLRALKSRA